MHHEICACSLLASERIPDCKSGKQKLSRISVILVTKKSRASDNGRRGARQVKSLASSGTEPQGKKGKRIICKWSTAEGMCGLE